MESRPTFPRLIKQNRLTLIGSLGTAGESETLSRIATDVYVFNVLDKNTQNDWRREQLVVMSSNKDKNTMYSTSTIELPIVQNRPLTWKELEASIKTVTGTQRFSGVIVRGLDKIVNPAEITAENLNSLDNLAKRTKGTIIATMQISSELAPEIPEFSKGKYGLVMVPANGDSNSTLRESARLLKVVDFSKPTRTPIKSYWTRRANLHDDENQIIVSGIREFKLEPIFARFGFKPFTVGDLKESGLYHRWLRHKADLPESWVEVKSIGGEVMTRKTWRMDALWTG